MGLGVRWSELVESEAQSETSLVGLRESVDWGRAELGRQRFSVCIILVYYVETNSRETDMAAGETGGCKSTQSRALDHCKGRRTQGRARESSEVKGYIRYKGSKRVGVPNFIVKLANFLSKTLAFPLINAKSVDTGLNWLD